MQHPSEPATSACPLTAPSISASTSPYFKAGGSVIRSQDATALHLPVSSFEITAIPKCVEALTPSCSLRANRPSSHASQSPSASLLFFRDGVLLFKTRRISQDFPRVVNQDDQKFEPFMQTPSEPATSTCSSDHSVDIGVPALVYGSGLGTKDSLGGLAGPCAPAALGYAQFFRAFRNTTYQV